MRAWHPRGILIQYYLRARCVTRFYERTLLQEVIHGGEWVWPRSTAVEVIQIMAVIPLIQGGPDLIVWNANGGSFSISSVLELFQPHPPSVGWSILLGGPVKILPWNSLCFGWLYRISCPDWISRGYSIWVLVVCCVECRLASWNCFGCSAVAWYPSSECFLPFPPCWPCYHLWMERNMRHFQ
ncbi:hypothetical protein Salat_1807900 [Sesamum alatum]|uniref:Uncharacterized protein n=1 Tax=Sesamum alatum TaxID=300844 RepID=A0AAE2CHB7_9LAMI|nr:hypothetical protein Salat_1807900 [Sesamum alatum]